MRLEFAWSLKQTNIPNKFPRTTVHTTQAKGIVAAKAPEENNT